MKPMRFYTAKTMQEADKFTINTLGVPSLSLMENASSLFTQTLIELEGGIKELENKKILVLAGKGNNGGDALAVARRLLNYLERENIFIFVFGKDEEFKEDAKRQLQILRNLGALIFNIKEVSLEKFEGYLNQIDILVDGIFGTGLERPVEGFYKEVIKAVNRKKEEKKFRVYSVDLPSGLNASLPFPIGEAIKADVSVTFAGPKVAHLFPETIKYTGKTYVGDISIPNSMDFEEFTATYLLERPFIKSIYPKLENPTHKYKQGYLGILGGSIGKTGAVCLSALASLRVGLGLSTVIVPKSLNDIFEIKLTEEMSIPLEDKGLSHFGPYSYEDFEKKVLNSKIDALVLGPGMGVTPQTQAFVKKLLEVWEKPILIDADGLNNLALYPEIIKTRKIPAILTPHFGEFVRLAKKFLEEYYGDISLEEIQKNILEIGSNFAEEYNSILVLKGERTLIFTPQREIFINVDTEPFLPLLRKLSFLGNPGMATAGTGDVLAGIIGGYLARLAKQEKDPSLKAALIGVYIHGLAGDLAALDLGEESLKASNIIDYISKAIKTIKNCERCY